MGKRRMQRDLRRMQRGLQLLERVEQLVLRLEAWLPPVAASVWVDAPAYTWHSLPNGGGRLMPIAQPTPISLDELLHIDTQKAALVQNTRQWLRGLPANHALLTGARGTGKSSLIRALLTTYHPEGLRVVELHREQLLELPYLCAQLGQRPERFILYCDDLSFAAGDQSYTALKAVLDGSVLQPPANVLLYATSNRRHLLPEYGADNQAARLVEGELHPGEVVEEKISLSERFGLWLTFYPFSQEQYLAVVAQRLAAWQLALDAETRQAALQYALQRGSRSGRVAAQFVRAWVGLRRC